MYSQNEDRLSAPGIETDDQVWRLARQNGIGRRRFLQLLATGGTAAVLSACGALNLPQRSESEPAPGDASMLDSHEWFKDAAPFVQRDGGLEARLENMQGVITPNDFFFVRNNSVSMDIEAGAWSLSVEGDAISRPMEFSYEDIRNMPSRTLVSYLECAGNQRVMFNLVNGQETEGTQWGTGAVGNGEWTGVPLPEILRRAGISGDTVSVLMIGLDEDSPEDGFRRVLPVEKAMDSDTILAYALNGEVLPKDHGFPLRVIAPGWVGSSCIKWLGRIVVSSEKLWTRNNTTSYVLIGDGYQPEGQAEGQEVTTQSIKSALALPWPATLSKGSRLIRGFAHSPNGSIAKVEWSADSGRNWMNARVLEPQPQRSWARFEFVWGPPPGEYTLMTRATDSTGATQPETVPFNRKGYLFNQPLPHPIRIT